MRAPEPTALPLDYVAEIVLELGLVRDECVNAARAVMARKPLDEKLLEDCARLDDAVALAHRILQSNLKALQHARALGKSPRG